MSYTFNNLKRFILRVRMTQENFIKRVNFKCPVDLPEDIDMNTRKQNCHYFGCLYLLYGECPIIKER